MIFEVLAEIRLKDGVADPQGATVARALPALGFEGVTQVRVGKAIRVSLEAPDAAAAESKVRAMCETLLANPIIEEAAVTVLTPSVA
jgi:phosphoribosylformylglycinamidine synthase PurS subunit